MAERTVRAISPEGAVRRFRKGVRALTASDPGMAAIVKEAGPPPIALRDPGFPTLLRAVCAQQISAAATARVQNGFSWDQYVSRAMSAYENLLN